jgi:hypothetical protein
MTTQYFNYNKQKTIQALRYHFISRKEIKMMIILINVFSILSAGLYFYNKISPTAFLLSSALWLLMMFMFWFLLPTIVYKKSPSFKQRLKVSINDDSFILENENGQKRWEWTAFNNWIESPHFFHLYFNATSFFLIPKDCFEGDAEHEARNYFKEKIKK